MHRSGALRHLTCRLVRKARFLAQALSDLGDLLGRIVRSEDSRLGGQVDRRSTLGRICLDRQGLTRLRMGPVNTALSSW